MRIRAPIKLTVLGIPTTDKDGNPNAYLKVRRFQWRPQAGQPFAACGRKLVRHVQGDSPRFREHASKLGLEGAISKRAEQPYAPGDRGIWVKSKCLNREEFVVVGWTDPEGSRRHIGALLLGYAKEDGRAAGGAEDAACRATAA